MCGLQNDSHHLSQPPVPVCSGFGGVGGWGFGSDTPPTLGSVCGASVTAPPPPRGNLMRFHSEFHSTAQCWHTSTPSNE